MSDQDQITDAIRKFAKAMLDRGEVSLYDVAEAFAVLSEEFETTLLFVSPDNKPEGDGT